MDNREISARLHDILRAASRVRTPGPGSSPGAGVESIDQLKARVRALIADMGETEAPRLPLRLRANAADFPTGRIPGTRAIVQHRRRSRDPLRQPSKPRGTSEPRSIDARTAADALFQAPAEHRPEDQAAAAL